MNTTTADLGAQIAEQRDKITETVTALAEKIDTGAIKDRAAAGADDLRDTAKDAKGRKGLIVGAIAALVGLILVRRLLG